MILTAASTPLALPCLSFPDHEVLSGTESLLLEGCREKSFMPLKQLELRSLYPAAQPSSLASQTPHKWAKGCSSLTWSSPLRGSGSEAAEDQWHSAGCRALGAPSTPFPMSLLKVDQSSHFLSLWKVNKQKTGQFSRGTLVCRTGRPEHKNPFIGVISTLYSKSWSKLI